MVQKQINLLKEKSKPVIDFFSQQKVQNIILIILFLSIIIWTSSIRLSNVPLLKDSTTGKYIPLALDPFYFLRLAETINSEGSLPEYDLMRYPSLKVGFSQEILPQAIIFLYKGANIFGEYSLQQIDILSPVVFYILGMILFFLLIWSLTSNKWLAFLSSGFLAVIPPYLYRTMAGFSDHEAIGMFAFFFTLLVLSLSLKYLEKLKKINWQLILLSLILAFSTIFSLLSWGGIAKFLFMIIPLSFLLIWLIESKNKGSNSLLPHLIFYLIWVVFTLIFGEFFSYSSIILIKGYLLSTSGILTLFLAIFFPINYFFEKYFLKKVNKKLQQYPLLTSGVITLFLGTIFFSIFVGNLGDLLSQIGGRLLQPFGAGRVGLTVAENAQPYLIDWFSQIGKVVFWIFYLGMLFLGFDISKGIKKKKEKRFFFASWIILISSLLFSRISGNSFLNGENFISQLFYFLGALIFIFYSIIAYLKSEIRINSNLILIFAWLVPMLIATRGAIRLFFAIVPFICFMIAYFIFSLVKLFKKNKEGTTKTLVGILLILASIGLIINFIGFSETISTQAKYTGPSANQQWQQAMSWVRNNTQEGKIFVHWWDYGYWVEYLGERPSVTDGGHANSYWDHLIGRYVLTTPNPETAYSFMKAQNASYLLIDPSDIGKYGAYSKIGSDLEGEDRYSTLSVMISDPSQIQEKANSVVRIFKGGTIVDQDIIYAINGKEIFLPAYKSAIIGVIIETTTEGNFIQPKGVFSYNGAQIQLPLKYIYLGGEMIEFEKGIESTISIIPRIISSNQGYQADNFGALIYLSPKTMNSLVAQVYLLNDSFGRYDGLELVHSEKSPYLNGANIGDFFYFNGIQGPIKIWKINVPEEIIGREEFLSLTGEYAELDNLKFVK